MVGAVLFRQRGFSALLTLATTVAPSALATWMVAMPTPPAAPLSARFRPAGIGRVDQCEWPWVGDAHGRSVGETHGVRHQ